MQSQEMKANIVFIITDQWRGDCLSIAGHPVVETPNLDMLAASGTLFSASYSSCPSCIAARASIFTGLRPRTHGRVGYKDRVEWCYEDMLPEVLSRGGYQTHCVGKTHFYPQRAHLGFHSIDSYEGWQNFDGQYVNDYHEWLREKTNGMWREEDHGIDSNSWYARPSHLPEQLHNNTWVATKGIEFLRRRDRTRPFFLNLSFHRPHPPVDPPQVYYDMYKDRDLPPVPVGDWAEKFDTPVRGVNDWRGRLPENLLDRYRRAYFAQIAHIDNQIGRFILAMKLQKPGPTYFIFTSDHGEMLGDHHLFRKTYAFEGSARTPMIIASPFGASEHLCDAPIDQEDIMPTLLDMAGLAVPGKVEGHSMLPLMSQKPEETGWREFMHGEHSECYQSDMGMQYLTDGREKYIWYTESGREQLFNLVNDRQELHDLAQNPEHNNRLELWRSRMAENLADRTGAKLSDGKNLIPGTKLQAVDIKKT